MYIIAFFLGIIIGTIFTIIKSKDYKIYGIIDVDKKTCLCRFKISSDELGNSNLKSATFKINYDVDLNTDTDDSRNELGL